MDEVLDLLQAWDLPELGLTFKKNKITLHALAALSTEDLKELIPELGPRTLFVRCWKVWQADFLSSTNSQETLTITATASSAEENSFINSSLNISDLANNISLSNLPILTVDELERETELSTIYNAPEQPQPEAEYETKPLPSDNILLKLLKENFEASSLLRNVGKALEDDSARNLLASIICKQILKENKNSPITSHTYIKWSREIKALFPNESIVTYYIPPCVTAQGINHQARGKLVSQLLNIRRKYQKLGVLEVKERKQISERLTTNASPRPLPNFNTFPGTSYNVQDDLDWIKTSSDPWTLVETKWNATFQKRSINLRQPNYSVEEYFAEYPAIKKPLGYQLLVKDFENSYPEHVNNFHLNFHRVKARLIEIFKKKKIKDNYCNDIIKLANEQSEEKQNIAAILTLPEIIQSNIVSIPTNSNDIPSTSQSGTPVKRKKIKDNKWRPTKAESREAFVTLIHDDSYLNMVISKRHKKTLEKGFTPQPYIVIVGPDIFSIKSYFVVVNPQIFYFLPNIVTSIDTCFKITWALNLEYSPCCYGPWLFIQKGFYKLSSSYDRGSTSVESLLTDCKLNID